MAVSHKPAILNAQSLQYVAPSQKTVPFFDVLPQELRDGIYNLSYCARDKDFKIKMRKRWVEYEFNQMQCTSGRKPRAFPQHPLSDMIVSKRYYSEAGAVWFRSVTFHLESEDSLDSYLAQLSYSQRDNVVSLTINWTFESYLDSYDKFDALQAFRNLRELTLIVSDQVFRPCDTKLACIESLTSRDFEKIRSLRNIGVNLLPEQARLRFVASPKITARCESWNDGSSAQWLSNIEALNKHVNDRREDERVRRSMQKASQVMGQDASLVYQQEEEQLVLEAIESQGMCEEPCVPEQPHAPTQQANSVQQLAPECTDSQAPCGENKLHVELSTSGVALVLSVVAVVLSSIALARGRR